MSLATSVDRESLQGYSNVLLLIYSTTRRLNTLVGLQLLQFVLEKHVFTLYIDAGQN
jgi:hypothetical protein